MRSWGAENSVLQEGALGKATLGARDSEDAGESQGRGDREGGKRVFCISFLIAAVISKPLLA